MISIFRIYYFFTLATRNGKKSVKRPLPKGRIYAHTYKKRISVNMDMRIYAGYFIDMQKYGYAYFS